MSDEQPEPERPELAPFEVVALLRKLQQEFYWSCFHAGVGSYAHAFMEFNGLMSKYVDLLGRAVAAGIDPMHVNEHVGVAMPLEAHDMKYFGEKLRCMLGPVLDTDLDARGALRRALFEPIEHDPTAVARIETEEFRRRFDVLLRNYLEVMMEVGAIAKLSGTVVHHNSLALDERRGIAMPVRIIVDYGAIVPASVLAAVIEKAKAAPGTVEPGAVEAALADREEPP